MPLAGAAQRVADQLEDLAEGASLWRDGWIRRRLSGQWVVGVKPRRLRDESDGDRDQAHHESELTEPPTFHCARLVVHLEDVAEGPHPPEALAPDREVRTHDHRATEACAEPEPPIHFEVAEADRRLAGNHLPDVGKNRHVEAAKDVPAVLNVHEDAVVVVVAVPREPPQVVVSAERRHEEHWNELTLVLIRKRRRRAERDDAGLVEVRHVVLELELGLPEVELVERAIDVLSPPDAV